MLYLALKYVHILLAIVAVGFNASYAVWLARAAREPEHESHVLRGIKLLDDRFANPAYGLLLVTGLAMVFVARLDLRTQLWIDVALGLWLLLVLGGLAVYTPTLRRQIAALESSGPGSAEYRALSSRATAAGIVLAVIALVIVALMVFKPRLG
jgi:uncharacterized membrane protein